jgi:uracil-DNA glycosylase
VRELDLLTRLRVVVALGAFAYEATWRALGDAEIARPARRPRFAHGLEVEVGLGAVVCSFHPSQQNTFTGRLTAEMLDAVLARARALAGG